MPRRLAPLLVAACLAALAWPAGAASGDADPASDFLPGLDVFLPYGKPVSKPVATQLNTLAKAARTKGHIYKVAIIASPTDLGGVTSLYGKPQLYVKFLYHEISPILQGEDATLVVAMPNGIAVAGRDATAAGRAAVARVHPPANGSSTQLGTTTVAAVEAVAAANGHPLPHVAPGQSATGGGGHGGRTKLILVVVAVLAAGVGVAMIVRARAGLRAAE